MVVLSKKHENVLQLLINWLFFSVHLRPSDNRQLMNVAITINLSIHVSYFT